MRCPEAGRGSDDAVTCHGCGADLAAAHRPRPRRPRARHPARGPLRRHPARASPRPPPRARRIEPGAGPPARRPRSRSSSSALARRYQDRHPTGRAADGARPRARPDHRYDTPPARAGRRRPLRRRRRDRPPRRPTSSRRWWTSSRVAVTSWRRRPAGRVWVVTHRAEQLEPAQEIDTADGVDDQRAGPGRGLRQRRRDAGLVVERPFGLARGRGGRRRHDARARPKARCSSPPRETSRDACRRTAPARECDVIVDNVATGTTREIPVELAARAPRSPRSRPTDSASWSRAPTA